MATEDKDIKDEEFDEEESELSIWIYITNLS